jgi:transposase InsO family protein
MDAWSRRVVGWAMATHLRTELALDALNMALAQRQPDDVIHHSDQGCQGRFKWSSQHLNSEELRWDRGRKIERLIVLVGRRCGHRDGRLGGGVNTNNDFGKQ